MPRAYVARDSANGAGVRSLALFTAFNDERAAAASAKSNVPSPDERMCARAENTVALAWQLSAHDGRAKASAHLSRKSNKNSCAHVNKQKEHATPKQNFEISTAAREPPPYSKSTQAENFLRARTELANNSAEPRAVVCQVWLTWPRRLSMHCRPEISTQVLRLRRCGSYGTQLSLSRCAIGSQSKASTFSANAVASVGKGATHVFTDAVIDGVRIADELVDTGSAFSMLSTAMNGRLPIVPAIQRFTESASNVIGVGGASAEIRGYVDMPVKLMASPCAIPFRLLKSSRFRF